HGFFHGVKNRRVADCPLATLAGGDTGDNLSAIVDHLLGMECAFAPGDALDGQACIFTYQDAHADSPFAAATAFWAASARLVAVIKLASAKMRRPSSSLVPTKRTTNGTLFSRVSMAARTPRATSSQRVMPPKMLINTAWTRSSARMIRSAVATLSACAPPPTSKKLA